MRTLEQIIALMRLQNTPYWALEGFASSKNIEGVTLESSIEYLQQVLSQLGPGNYSMTATENTSPNARKYKWAFSYGNSSNNNSPQVGAIPEAFLTQITALNERLQQMEKEREEEKRRLEREKYEREIAELKAKNKELEQTHNTVDGQFALLSSHVVSGIMKWMDIPVPKSEPQRIAGTNEDSNEEEQQQRVITALETLASARGINYIAELEKLANLAKNEPHKYDMGLKFL